VVKYDPFPIRKNSKLRKSWAFMEAMGFAHEKSLFRVFALKGMLLGSRAMPAPRTASPTAIMPYRRLMGFSPRITDIPNGASVNAASKIQS
jgi:hypothetical protein